MKTVNCCRFKRADISKVKLRVHRILQRCSLWFYVPHVLLQSRHA
jgi:hypothetical protein